MDGNEKMDALRVCWTGDWNCSTLQPILAETDTGVSVVPLEQLAAGTVDPSPQVIVIAQSYRDQFAQELIEQIWTHYPHAALVNLLSSECEGDIRANSALRGVVRVFWYQWSQEWARIEREWRIAGLTSWHAARTSSTADMLLCSGILNGNQQRSFHLPASNPSERSGDTRGSAQRDTRAVAILESDTAFADALCDAVSIAGFQPIRFRADHDSNMGIANSPDQSSDHAETDCGGTSRMTLADPGTNASVTAVCIDATTVDDRLMEELGQAKRSFPGVPILVTLGFPRTQDHRRLRDFGIAEVVAKPFSIETLAAALTKICHESEGHSVSARRTA